MIHYSKMVLHILFWIGIVVFIVVCLCQMITHEIKATTINTKNIESKEPSKDRYIHWYCDELLPGAYPDYKSASAQKDRLECAKIKTLQHIERILIDQYGE